MVRCTKLNAWRRTILWRWRRSILEILRSSVRGSPSQPYERSSCWRWWIIRTSSAWGRSSSPKHPFATTTEVSLYICIHTQKDPHSWCSITWIMILPDYIGWRTPSHSHNWNASSNKSWRGSSTSTRIVSYIEIWRVLISCWIIRVKWVSLILVWLGRWASYRMRSIHTRLWRYGTEHRNYWWDRATTPPR